MTDNNIKLFVQALKVSTPLIALNCFDPVQTMMMIQKHLAFECMKRPILQWDGIRGLVARNNRGSEIISEMLSDKPQKLTKNLVATLELLELAPEDTLIFLLNGHHWFQNPDNSGKNNGHIQALWNVRDEFSSKGKCAVMLQPGIDLPLELKNDVLVINEELPTKEEISDIIDNIIEGTGDESNGVAPLKLSKKNKAEAVTALTGIAAFPAEQAFSLSLTESGLDLDILWDKKCELIRQTKGLEVWRDLPGFDQIGGLSAIKERFTRIIKGKKKPKIIVWIDEIEKALAGANFDTSGTSTDQLGVLLTEMTERKYDGSICVGVPGTAKSVLAKAVAKEAECLLIRLDLGDLKGSLVGQSEQNIRQCVNIINSIAGDGGAFFIATSNDIEAIKSELKRRFKKGIWFFDIPSKNEQDEIWKLNFAKYKEFKSTKISDLKNIEYSNWTGAEIEACVEIAYTESCTLQEASQYIIPVAVSGRQVVENLREQANQRFLSTNQPGRYVYKQSKKVAK